METFAPPHPTTNLSPNVYFQIVHTLTTLLPPPLDDSSGALHARNNTAIAKVASMFPVNANEADLAARSVVAGAQADDVMRLIRENAHDFALTTRLHAQYASMARTSTAAQAMLIRVQAVRRKREAIKGAIDEDAWTRHAVEQSMLRVADPETERVLAASPLAARGEAPLAARGAAPGEASGAARGEAPPVSEATPAEAQIAAAAPQGNRERAANVSQNNTNSHCMAFETAMSSPRQNQNADQTATPRDAKDAHANPEIAAANEVATPDPRHQVAPVQAAPAKPAAPPAAPTAFGPTPRPGLHSPRMADPRDKLAWADAMNVVAAEMTAGLSALPPALRSQEQMRARLLSSVASEITLQAGGALPQHQALAMPKR
jgi:hypothetical protein